MQSQIWASAIPLHITHSSSPIPYLIHVPRVSYLPLLLPRLSTFFSPASCSSFSYEGIQLKNLPVGLLCDLYQPSLPWRLALGDGPLFDIHDTFMNSVKEADFIRNGTAKGIMSLSKLDSTTLWSSICDNDYSAYVSVHARLLNPATPLKHIPLRIYIPSSPSSPPSPAPTPAPTSSPSPSAAAGEKPGEFKIVQTLVSPLRGEGNGREVQTLGGALNAVLPSLFPSRRDVILAEPVLHGAVVPMRAPVEEVMREAAYADGWVHLCVVMVDA